jgi:hypothetical protein
MHKISTQGIGGPSSNQAYANRSLNDWSDWNDILTLNLEPLNVEPRDDGF